MLTYVLNADKTPLMPCHPSRARELVRKDKAYWIKRDTICLIEQRKNPQVQSVTVGVDSGAEHIGVAAVALRANHRSKVIFRLQAEARPMREIKELMDERRSYRRGRRSRAWYRRPWFSPTRRVKLSAKLFNKEGEFLYKLSVAEAKALLKPDGKGNPVAKRLKGNSIQLLTGHQPPVPQREKQPGKNDVLVYNVDGKLITWYDSKRGDYKELEKHLLGQTTKGKRKKPLAKLETLNNRTCFVLLSKSAEDKIPKSVLPNTLSPVRKFGQIKRDRAWLAPSAQALLNAHIRAITELKKYVPVEFIRVEVAAFDTQKLKDPTIQGAGYQKPEMYAKQNRKDFVLARDDWKCVYCGAKNVPLTFDHIYPKSLGGSDDVKNGLCACLKCQQEKGNKLIEDFLKTKTPKEADRIRQYIKKLGAKNQNLHSTAHVGQIKTKLVEQLQASVTRGYVTKRDRIHMKLPKSHDYDAVAIASFGKRVGTAMPALRTYFVRRYSKGKAARRQLYKSNPISPKTDKKTLVLTQVGKGKTQRWTQKIGVNPFLLTPVGKIRLRDVVQIQDGRVGYVRKLNSNQTVQLSKRPSGKSKNEELCMIKTSKVVKIIHKQTGFMEYFK